MTRARTAAERDECAAATAGWGADGIDPDAADANAAPTSGPRTRAPRRPYCPFSDVSYTRSGGPRYVPAEPGKARRILQGSTSCRVRDGAFPRSAAATSPTTVHT